MRCHFIPRHRETWPVRVQCRVFHVSRGVCYAWLRGSSNYPAIRRAEFAERIPEIHSPPQRANPGASRLDRELLAAGHHCDRKAVAKLICQAGRRAKICRGFRLPAITANSDWHRWASAAAWAASTTAGITPRPNRGSPRSRKNWFIRRPTPPAMLCGEQLPWGDHWSSRSKCFTIAIGATPRLPTERQTPCITPNLEPR